MPPDLSEDARPLAVLPSQSCGDVTTVNPPPTPDVRNSINNSSGIAGEGLHSHCDAGCTSPPPAVAKEDHCSSSGNTGQGEVCLQQQPQGQVLASRVGNGGSCSGGVRGEITTVTSAVSLCHLSPALRAAFTSVGAPSYPIPFREVLNKHRIFITLSCLFKEMQMFKVILLHSAISDNFLTVL